MKMLVSGQKRVCGIGLLLMWAMGSLAFSEPELPPLIPIPREIRLEHWVGLNGAVEIRSSTNKDDRFAARDLELALHEDRIERHRANAGSVIIELLRLDAPRAKEILAHRHLVFANEMREEGYILVSEANVLFDIAATSAGIFYGVQTIKQLVNGRGRDARLCKVIARDWPAMKYRGQDDDLSRGPVPTLEYQEKQIRTLASFKINIYSPYFENTLQFASNPLPAPPGGAMSRAEIEELVPYAAQYHIVVVPEQEAFGHLHQVLKYEHYSQLAETPHGSVLSPGQPGSLQLIGKWFTEMAELFPGALFHIGADETDDLGQGQTKEAVANRGLGQVYIDFLKQIHDELLPLHRRLLFWGDVAMNSPESVQTLPKDMIAVAWQYSPPGGGFDKWLMPYHDAGIETWVAPSANRGSRIDPDNDNNLRTIQQFVADGQRLGATGMLNTVWDDGGEGLFEQDWYSVLFGAAASWQSGTSDIQRFERSYGQVFHNDTTGDVDQAQIELMQAHLVLAKAGLYAKNTLFWEDPWSEAGQIAMARILPVAHDLRVHAENAIVLIELARNCDGVRNTDALDAMELGARKFDFIGQKFQQAEEMMDEYNKMYANQGDKNKHDSIMDISYTISGVDGQCQDMRNGYGLIRDLYKSAWLKENRPYWLDNVLAEYDMSMQLWIHRGIVLRAAADHFDSDRTKRLPPPQSVGLPEGPTAEKGH